jgi:hypothetical protein
MRTNCPYRISIRFRNTLSDNLWVAFLMTSITAVFTLVTFTSKQELLTEGTQDRLVELLLNELVTIHLEHVPTPLSHGSLSTQTSNLIERPLLDVLLDYIGLMISRILKQQKRKTYQSRGEERQHPQVRQQTSRQYLGRLCSWVQILPISWLLGEGIDRDCVVVLLRDLGW